MAVGASLGLPSAHRVWNKGAEGLPAETFRRNCLLLVIDPIAVVVLRTHKHGACRAHRRDPMTCNGAINGQTEDVVTQNLKIVRSPIARCQAFIVKHRHLLICGHRKMAAITSRSPRTVARVTSHPAVLVRQLRWITI